MTPAGGGALSSPRGKSRVILLIALCLAACHPFPLPYVQGPYSGDVTDENTGTPIGDAVVVAEWCYDYPRMDGGPIGVSVAEAVTDERGTFHIPRRIGVIWNPFGYPLRAKIRVFRPGYSECSWPFGGTDEKCRPPHIKLHKYSSPEEREKMSIFGPVRRDLQQNQTDHEWCGGLPGARLPQLTRMVQAEETYVGKPVPGRLDPEEIDRLWHLVLDRPSAERLPRPDYSYTGVAAAPSGYSCGAERVAAFHSQGGALSIGASIPSVGVVSEVYAKYFEVFDCFDKEQTVLLGLMGRKPPCDVCRIALGVAPEPATRPVPRADPPVCVHRGPAPQFLGRDENGAALVRTEGGSTLSVRIGQEIPGWGEVSAVGETLELTCTVAAEERAAKQAAGAVPEAMRRFVIPRQQSLPHLIAR